eukprot:jgi/Mesvir1/11145/Mv04587-RA.1
MRNYHHTTIPRFYGGPGWRDPFRDTRPYAHARPWIPYPSFPNQFVSKRELVRSMETLPQTTADERKVLGDARRAMSEDIADYWVGSQDSAHNKAYAWYSAAANPPPLNNAYDQARRDDLRLMHGYPDKRDQLTEHLAIKRTQGGRLQDPQFWTIDY